MNKIYKVIWNEARKCYVVVAEIAKNHGKNNVRSIVERLAAKSMQAVLELMTAAQHAAGSALPAVKQENLTPAQWIVPLMLAGILLQPVSAWATTITRGTKDSSGNSISVGGVIDKNEAGTVYDIYAQEIATKGDFGVNRFNQFSLDKGHIANMHFNHKGGDTTVSNLVNLVENRISISGTVNAIKSGIIDGNLYFISPKGMYLGPSGVINAGSFTGIAASSDYFNKLWDHTYNIGTDITKNSDGTTSGGLSSDLQNFGRRGATGSYNSMSDLTLSTGSADTEGIQIKGKINTRSGIVLGAGKIQIVENAVLKSNTSIDFTNLVNAKDESGNTVTNTTLSGADLTAVDDAETGDIILRAENTTSYDKNVLSSIVTNIVDTALNSTNETSVEVAGSLQSDGNVDVSASATSEFDNTGFDLASQITNVQDLQQEFLTEMGFNWAADWAKKNNKASVKLADTGSIQAGGAAYLQSDAKVDVKVKSATVHKEEGTSTAIPVIAIAVGVTDNEAKVDVEGAVNTTGNLSMAANAETKLDISASASAQNKPTDPGNQLFFGVSWATGNNKAELNVKDLKVKDENGNATTTTNTITAGGDLSVSASSTSEVSSEGEATGKDETVASVAISVLDYDSAANVNIERSMEGKSITGSATNKYKKLKIKAKNGTGEGSVFEPMKGISFMVKGDGNASTIIGKIKSKFNLSGITNNGKLKDLEEAFKKVQEYVTAGAGIAVAESENTARVTVAPEVDLKATGPATITTTSTDSNGNETTSTSESGYVKLSASTETKKLHHNVVGEANKQKSQNSTDSDFDIAAAVSYSDIENNAIVELQSKNNKGPRLTAQNGNVNISVSSKQDYDAKEAVDSVVEMAQLWLMMIEKTISDATDTSSMKQKSVTLTKQASNETTSDEPSDTAQSQGSTLSDEEIAKLQEIAGELQGYVDQGTQLSNSGITTTSDKTDVSDFATGFMTYLNTLVEDVDTDLKITKGLIGSVSDLVDPASYTNYYVRSKVSDDNKNKLAMSVSLNIAEFKNKSVVSVGEGSEISAGNSITVETDTKVDVVSGTGNGAEYFGFGTQTNGNGVGASIGVEEFSGDSMILVGKNVTMTGPKNDNNENTKTGDVTLHAKNDMDQVGIILASGEADDTLSITGSASALIGDSNSLVFVDDEAMVNSAGTLTLQAENDSTVTNVVGGLTLGSSHTNLSMGMGLALNMLDDNSIAVVADNGSDASTTAAEVTGTTEEQNKIKAQNTLAYARELANKRTKGLSSNDDITVTTTTTNDDNTTTETTTTTSALIASLGTMTAANADKGSITAKDMEVRSDNGGTINAIALEGASSSNNHSALETLNKWSQATSEQKNKLVISAMTILGAPSTAMNNVFNNSLSTIKSKSMGTLKTMNHNDDDSDNGFNASATASFAWNQIDGNTAAMIDNITLNLGGEDGNGSLYNGASDDVWNGAWSGSAAWNWYKTGQGSRSNDDAIKGAVGAAVGVNRIERGVKAVVSNTDITGAGLVQNTVYKDGTDVAAAIGVAVTNDSQGEGGDFAGSFGFAYNATNNAIHALLIDNTTQNTVQITTGNTTENKETVIENSAYNEDIQVSGGLDVSYANAEEESKSVGVGITCAVSLLDNDMQSGIQGGTYENVSKMQVSVEEALTQVNAAVGLGFNGSEEGFAGAGSLAYSDLDNVSHAYISGTDKIEVSGEVSAIAQDVKQKNKDGSYTKRKEYLENRKLDPTGESYVKQLGGNDTDGDSSGVDYKSSLGTADSSTIVNVAVEAAATTKKQSKTPVVGAAVALALVDNQFNVDIKDNKNLTADKVAGEANVSTDIVGVSAGVSYSSESFGGAGSLAFNDLDQDNIVSITGNRNDTTTNNTGNTGITANTVSGTANNSSKIINVAGDFAGGKNALGLGIAYNRMDDTTGVFMANNNIQAKDSSKGVDISLDADNDAYALAVSVGAAVTTQARSTFAVEGNFGINRGHNDTMAVIGEDKDGYKWDKSAGASSNTGSDTSGDTGSNTSSNTNSNTSSNNWTTRDKITNAKSITVNSEDDTQKTAVVGDLNLNTKGSKAGLGIAVALTESDSSDDYSQDGKESLRAVINNADITTVQTSTTDDEENTTTTTGASIKASSSDKSSATTIAVGIGYSKESTIDAQGVGADARINKHNTAGLQDTTIDKDESKGALVDIDASTESTLKTGAAALQISAGGESTLTGVIAVGVNRIKDDTVAGVTFTKDSSGNLNVGTAGVDNIIKVGNLSAESVSSGKITSIAAGVSVSTDSTATFGGTGSHNFIQNNVSAKIVNADINSTGNVGVVAQSDETINNYAGVVDVNLGTVAIGVTGSYNKLTGTTTALIENSKVVAAGSESNKIKTKSSMNSNALISKSVSSDTWSASGLKDGRQTEEKTGVVVDASGTHAIASDMANAGVAVDSDGLGVSVAGVINLNYISGATTAKIVDSQINQGEDEQNNQEEIRSDVTVNAGDYTNLGEFAGVASVGVGSSSVGLAAGVNVNVNQIDRTTGAAVTTNGTWNDDNSYYEVTETSKEKNKIYAENFSVTADSVQAMSSLNVAVAVAAGAEGGGQTGDNVNVSKLESSTAAAVTNATVDFTKDAKVEATHEDRVYDMNIAAGVAAGATGAGSLNVGVGVINEYSSATAAVKYSDIMKSENATGTVKSDNTTATADISIKADNTTKMESTLVSAGVAAAMFSAGVGSSISVNEVNNRATTSIYSSTLKADNININTANTIKMDNTTGEGAFGTMAGVGIGVEVDTLNSTATTLIQNSTLTAEDALSIETKTERELEGMVVGVGAGIAGVSVNVLSVTVNDGINSLENAVDADATDSENNTVNFSHKNTINSITQQVNTDYGSDLSANFYSKEGASGDLTDVLYGMSDDEKDEMKDKAETRINNGNAVEGSGVHTYIQNGSTLTAGGDLTINNKELTDADLDGGSGSAGAVAVNVADVVFHLNEMSDIGVTDSSVTGGTVSMTAHQGNVTEGKDDAIYARMVQASAGLAAIGVGYSGITVKSEAENGVAGTGISVDNSSITATAGDLKLTSKDDARSKSEVIGASAGLMSVPISVTHNDNKADNYIEITGGSRLTAPTTQTRETTDANGNKTTVVTQQGKQIVLQAERTGRVEAQTKGVGAGGEVWAVNVAKGRNYGDATIGIDANGNTFTADLVAMQAVNAPKIHTEAGGISVSLTGVAVNHGQALAGSEEDPLKAKVTVNGGNTFNADDVMAQAIVGDANEETGEEMAYAYTRSISVSLADGGANKSKAITNTEAVVDMSEQTYKTVQETVTTTDEDGNETTETVTKAATDLALLTENNASRHSKLGNTSVGIGLSISFGDAKATGNDVSKVKAAGGSGSSSATKLKNLKINAGGSNTARGFADGDSGGILAVGASATITMESNTTNTTELSGAWDVAESADIGALQKVTGNGSSTTSSGGVLSVTWANSDNNITMDTQTKLADGAELTAGKSYVLAENQVKTGAYDGDDEGRTWNNNMSVGGVIQIAPDIDSEQTITTSATVDIGENVKVTTSNGQIFAAYADMDIYNYSKSDSGGLAENLWVYASTNIDNTNTITVNEGAQLTQNGAYKSGRDITLAACDVINMDVEAYASAGGLEGVTRAHADNDIKRNNLVEVNGSLTSSHDINLYAGVDEDGADSQLNITGVAEADNNTVASISTSPELNIDLQNNHQVKVGANGEGIAIRNINVSAYEGSENVKKTIIKTTNLFTSQDTEKSLLSNEGGDETLTETNDNFVKVEGLLKTGYQNNVKVELTGALIPSGTDTKSETTTTETRAGTDADQVGTRTTTTVTDNEDGTKTTVTIKTVTKEENGVKTVTTYTTTTVTQTYTFEPVSDTIGDFHVEVTNGSENPENTETVIQASDIKSGTMDYATYLSEQLAELNQLISAYNSGNSDNTTAYYGYITQRQRIYDEMDKKHMYTESTQIVYETNDDGSLKTDENGNYIVKGEETVKTYITSGYTIGYAEIPDIMVSGGDITVQSDNLYGTGKLEANGHPQIEIDNLSNAYLRTNVMSVGYDGGEIRFQGESIKSGDDGNEQINGLNNNDSYTAAFNPLYGDSNGDGESSITVFNNNESVGTTIMVRSKQDPQDKHAYTSVPDVEALGNITNNYGSVSIENKQGNITLSSVSVEGKSVTLTATKGSVAQDYTEGIVNIGGDPKTLNSSKADELQNSAKNSLDKEAGSDETVKIAENYNGVSTANDKGRIAGDSVYVSADTININGLIQSGYAQYTVEIPEYVQNEDGSDYTDKDGNKVKTLSEKHIQMLQNNGSAVTVKGKTMYKVNDGNKAVYEDSTGVYKYVAQVYYDPESGGLVVEDIETQGGKIYLTGDICSTGNGRVVAADGGAEISIINNANADLTTGKIINNDLEGKISITDTAKEGTTYTLYTRNGTTTITNYDNYGQTNYGQTDENNEQVAGTWTGTEATTAAIGWYDKDNPAYYEPESGLRYNWTKGTTTTTTTNYEKVTKSLFWGAWKYSSDTTALKNESTAENKTGGPYTKNGEPLSEGGFVDDTTIDASYADSDGKKLMEYEFGVVGDSWKTDETYTETDSWKESGDWWALWSNPKYHTTWTKTVGSTQTYTFSLKADKKIAVGFLGKDNGDGSITVKNTNTEGGNVKLDGNVQSATKDATVTVEAAGGGISQTSGYTITTGQVDLDAKENIEGINITSMGERIDTGEVDTNGKKIYTTDDRVLFSAVSYNGGNIDVEVVGGKADGQALPGNVVVKKLASKEPSASSNSSDRTSASGKMGNVSLKAEGNITQQVISLKEQFTESVDENGNATYYSSAEEYLQAKVQEQLANDATYQALTDDSAKEAYANGVMEKVTQVFGDKAAKAYDKFTSLKEKFTKTEATEDADATYYASAAEYLQNDEEYSKLSGIKKQIYAEKTEQEFAQFTEDDTVTVQGQKITLTSTKGTIGVFEESTDDNGAVQLEVKQAIVVKSGKEADSTSEDSASVNAEAKSHIYLKEKEGDMRVGSVISKDGDVFMEATDGRLIDARPQKEDTNSISTDDMIHKWIDAGLIAGTDDYEGDYMKSLKQYAKDYHDRVEKQYEQFEALDNGEKEKSLKKLFTKSDGTYYSSADEFLAQDATYQALDEDSKATYKTTVEGLYNQFKCDGEIQKKYTKSDGTWYTSTGEYLAQDEEYHRIVSETNDALVPYRTDVNEKWNDFKKKGAVSEYAGMFTKSTEVDSEGKVTVTYYDTVAEYMQNDSTYKSITLEQDNYEDTISDEYTNFINNKSNGQLSDMFTKSDGTFYESADEYLADDATFQAVVDKIENPQYAWTKEQMLNALRIAMVNKETGQTAETQKKAANIQGNNVKLTAKGVGINTDKITTITVDEITGGTDDAVSKMQQLANADAADVTMKDSDGNTLEYTSVEITRNGHKVDTQAWKAYTVDGDEKQLVYTQYATTETGEDGKTTVVWKTVDADSNAVETDGSLRLDSFEIANKSPLGVYATGRVDIKASGENAYIAGRYADGGESDDSNVDKSFSPINVGQITTAYQKVVGQDENGQDITEEARSDVRLYTQEGIYNATLTEDETIPARVVGQNLIAYGGKKDIGKVDDPLTVDLSGDLLGAYSDGSVHIKNVREDDLLRLGAVYAGKSILMESEKGYEMTANEKYADAYLNAKEVLTLATNEDEGTIGTKANPIRILNNTGTPDDYGGTSANNGTLINLASKDAYVKGVSGYLGDDTTMRLGLIDVKNVFSAVSTSHMEVGAVRTGYTGDDGTVYPSINGKIKAGNVVSLEATKDMKINGPVQAGVLTPNPEELEEEYAGEYTGGGEINLVSIEGTITQNNTIGTLTAKSVNVTTGTALSLTSEGNYFREFKAYGVEKEKTDEQGNTITVAAIDGDVNVAAHAGNNLTASIPNTIVYGNVSLENLDDATLTVGVEGIVARENEEDEGGNINIEQKGGIVTKGALDARNVTLGSQSGTIIVEDQSRVVAREDISISNVKGDISTGLQAVISAGHDIKIANEEGWTDISGDLNAGSNIVVTNQTGDSTLGGNLTAGNNIEATSTSGLIGMVGDLTAQNIKATSTSGLIGMAGDLNATNDIIASNVSGKIDLLGDLHAKNDIKITNQTGESTLEGNLTAGNDILATSTTGLIGMKGDLNAGRDIDASSTGGKILLLGDIDAGRDVKAKTGGEGGFIIFNDDVDDTKNIHAGRDVDLVSEYNGIGVGGRVVADTGDVKVKINTGAIEFLGDVKAGKDIAAMIVDGNEHSYIRYNGTTLAKGNVTATADEGDILYGNDVIALNGNVTAQTGKGNIGYYANVLAGDSVTADTTEGDIRVRNNVVAQTGKATMTTAEGSITVGEEALGVDGMPKGNILANGDVTINASRSTPADTNIVDILTSVESLTADVTVKTVNGNLHIGKNDADTDTVTAKQNVNLEAVNGKIIIDGKTSTKDGDVTLYAKSTKYTPGTDGKNIIINQSGKVEAGNDANLIAENGDLHVTDNVFAKGSLNAETRGEGDLYLDKDVTVINDMLMKTETGNINVGKKVDAADGNVTIKTTTGSVTIGETVHAGESVSVQTGTGNVTVGSNGKGSVVGDQQVNITTAGGDVDIVKSVASTSGSVNIKTVDGDIHVGNNGPTTDTVTAKENVTLETLGGKITVDGKTSTQDGDITLKAANRSYIEGENGKNIIINHTGLVESGRDATLITKNGDLHVTDNVNAKGTMYAKTETRGDILFDENVNAVNDMSMQTENGNIVVGKDVTADKGNVSMQTGTGNVIVGSNGQGSVTAGKDVAVNVGKGDVDIVKTVTSTGGSVSMKSVDGNIHVGNNGPTVNTVTAKENVTLEAADGKITVDGKTSTQVGDITLKAANKEYVAGEAGKNIIINNTGIVEAGRNANLIAKNGDLHVTDRVTAQDTLNARTETQGDILFDDDVNVVNNMAMETETGDITVGKDVTAANGNISMTVGTGNVTVGSNGVGTVTAGKDVTVNVGQGNVSIEKKVTSTSGSIDMLTKKGNIHVGNNGPDVETVTAGKNVKLETENGKIEVFGKTSNALDGGGDITLKAANETYVPGKDGQNIIIAQNGLVDSDHDVNLIAKNGDLHVTDRVRARNNVNAWTIDKGDVFLDGDLTVGGGISMKTDTGDINADGHVRALNGRIDASTGDGDINFNTADAVAVSLTSGGEDGYVRANAIYAEANGNSNGTGPEDIRLGGSHVFVDTVVNKGTGSATAPLTISTLGPDADKPMKDFNIGVKVADGVYTGGIESASGAVIQELWADRGMLYIKNDTNLHISKVVVNEKLHVANDNISVAVFGVPPYHDGVRMVYWNDAEAKNPSGRLARWYDRSYSDPEWMYLDLFGNGDVGSRYGVLMDAHWYRNIYGDSVSMVDTMRIRTAPIPMGDTITYFNRNHLIEIDDIGLYSDEGSYSDADPDEITAE